MDLDNAIRKHGEWKLKFRSAIANQASSDAASISRDGSCDLGKWLHGEARTRYAHLSSRADCLARHAAFHVEAGKVASTINAKKYDEAQAMLGAGTRYASASSAVGVAIIRLKKEAGL